MGRPLFVEVEGLGPVHVGTDLHARRHLEAFADSDRSVVLLDVADSNPPTVVSTLLRALVVAGQLAEDLLPAATSALLHSQPVLAPRPSFVLPHSTWLEPRVSLTSHIADTPSRDKLPPTPLGHLHWGQTLQGPGYVVAFGSVPGLQEGAVAFCRLLHTTNMGAQGCLTRFVVVVLGPGREVGPQHSPLYVARCHAAMLSDPVFVAEAVHAANPARLRAAVSVAVLRHVAEAHSVAIVTELNPFVRTGRLFGGLVRDIKHRARWYASDWLEGLVPWEGPSGAKYVATVAWLYCAIMLPSVAFGALNDANTTDAGSRGGSIGVVETMLGQALCGGIFAICSGQPLTVIMTTGPLTVYNAVLYQWTGAMGIPFLPFYGWVGLWTCLILLIVVAVEGNAVVQYVDTFTDRVGADWGPEEIFALLISCIFIGEFIKPLVESRTNDTMEVFLCNLLLALGTFLLCMWLVSWRRSLLLRPIIRTLLSDFGAPIAIVAMTGLKALLGVAVPTIQVPATGGLSTSSGRSWLVPLASVPAWAMVLACVPALLLSTLFVLDQNISSMLVAKPANRLRKGTGYDLDLLVVALLLLPCALLGLPFAHGALPQSPMHALQLADREDVQAHGRVYTRVVRSRETRWTGLVTHILIGLTVPIAHVLGVVPLGVLWGFFLYIGMAPLQGNHMWDRLLLVFTQAEKYPPSHVLRLVPSTRVHVYTAIQLLLLVILWFVKANFYLGSTVFNAGLLFPLVVALFVPIRMALLPRWFTHRELMALTANDDPDDE